MQRRQPFSPPSSAEQPHVKRAAQAAAAVTVEEVPWDMASPPPPRPGVASVPKTAPMTPTTQPPSAVQPPEQQQQQLPAVNATYLLSDYRALLPDGVTDSVRNAAIAAYEVSTPADPFSFHVGAGRIYGVDSFGASGCPFDKRFSVVRVLGAGSYGFVFEVHLEDRSNRGPSYARRYALKVQRMNYPRDASTGRVWPEDAWNYRAQPTRALTKDEAVVHTARNELAVHVLLNQLVHPNVIALYDWLRCTWAPPAVLLAEMQALRQWTPELVTPAIYQMTIVDYADGTLWGAVRDHLPHLPSAEAQLEWLRAALAQVVCALAQLSAQVGLEHRDLSAGNVLVVRDNFLQAGVITDALYGISYDSTSFMRVPMLATQYAVMKLNDFGMSRATYRASGHRNAFGTDTKTLHNQTQSPYKPAAWGDFPFLVGSIESLLLQQADSPVYAHPEWRALVASMAADERCTPLKATLNAFFDVYRVRLAASEVVHYVDGTTKNTLLLLYSTGAGLVERHPIEAERRV